MNYISTSEASAKWNISTSRITTLAKNGRIDGAILVGHSWMIPEIAEKPTDGRTRKGKQSEEVSFRFPVFEGIPTDSFIPPLSKAELQIKEMREAFIACDFDKAEKLFRKLQYDEFNIYQKITMLHSACMIYFIQNDLENFLLAYGELVCLLQKDFPYKKEMDIFVHEIGATLGIMNYFFEDFCIDPTYNYHPSFLPHLAGLTCVSLFSANVSDYTKCDLKTYEMNCIICERADYHSDAQTAHLHLAYAYSMLDLKEEMTFHLNRALELAEKYNLFWGPAVNYYYMKEYFDIVLKKHPKKLKNKLVSMSNDVHNRYVSFISLLSKKHIFGVLSQNDYLLVFYAVQGYLNKEIAKLLNISEKLVSKRYSRIYAKLGISSKNELIQYFHNDINNFTIH